MIEVVVATSIAGTLLATVVVAAGAHRTQMIRASQKKAAVEAMDCLLSAWAASSFAPEYLPQAVEASGVTLRGSWGATALPTNEILLEVRHQPRARHQAFRIEIIRVEAYRSREATDPISWTDVARPVR